jgi:U3 small nucleolar RNA-associated protein 7
VSLHAGQFFAAAQKKYTYIYDKRGVEIHCLKDHMHVNRLEFLPHHFLLASVGEQGILRYQDTSHGAIVAQFRTKLGRAARCSMYFWVWY